MYLRSLDRMRCYTLCHSYYPSILVILTVQIYVITVTYIYLNKSTVPKTDYLSRTIINQNIVTTTATKVEIGLTVDKGGRAAGRKIVDKQTRGPDINTVDNAGRETKGKLVMKGESSTGGKLLEKGERILSEYKEILAYLNKQNKTCNEDWNNKSLATGAKPLCACVPETLKRVLNIELRALPLSIIETTNIQSRGGHWQPSQCTSRYNLVVIIPFRDRTTHLNILLRYLHPVLQGQQLNYTIIVVEQRKPALFNKAALMNVGYVEAMKQFKHIDCIVFHDVDQIPEDGRHFYRCTSSVVHLGAYVSGLKYRLKYSTLFGGVTAFRPKVFAAINGFTNRFFGWGGEDDEMQSRIQVNKYEVERRPKAVARYRTIKHNRDSGNISPGSYAFNEYLYNNRNHTHDGLNSLKYKLVKVIPKRMYQLLYVDILNERGINETDTALILRKWELSHKKKLKHM